LHNDIGGLGHLGYYLKIFVGLQLYDAA